LRPGPIELEERVSPLDIAIRAEPQTDGDWSATAVATAIRELLLRNYPGATIESLQAIDPANARERLRDCLAVLAIVLVLMAVYFSSRFTWPYNAAATLALLLDTSLIVGLYALVQFPFDATSIAAILAVAGYSILDKGVLYGRMSKKLRARPDMSLRELVEGCIHEGLHRSIIVTGTATLAILPLAVLGSGSLQDLALVLLVGIIIAPMSSIFVAAPTLLLLGKALFAGDAGRSAAHIRPVR
jgi:SecD/SecF fusion protein